MRTLFGENKTFVSSDNDCDDSCIERMDDTRNWEPAVRGVTESREADAFYEKPCSGKTRHLYRQTTTVKTAAEKIRGYR